MSNPPPPSDQRTGRPSPKQDSGTNRGPWAHRICAEVCEPRLVLSAQPLLDIAHHAILDYQPWETLGESVCHSQPLTLEAPSTPSLPSLDPMLTEAHAGTGWQQSQQEFGLTGRGQTVAVIDSGIAWDHTALGKGFGAGYRVVGGWDFAENDALPYDDSPAGFHGTHVAGIIGANGQQKGVAPNVDLVALRVFDDIGNGQLEWTEKALQWVYQNRNHFENPITTVNLSLGTTWNSDTVPNWGTLEEELKQLYDSGIVVVASAGNSFTQYNAPGLSYPASSPYTIPVASVDSDGSLSDFSQRHERVIAAPGQNIVSTVPDHVLGRDGKIDDWTVASGTSMAAPYVAGAAVLVREAMELAGYSSIDSKSIYAVLQDTSASVWDSITKQAYDRLDLHSAIDSIIPDDTVGDSLVQASLIEVRQGASTAGWLNQLGDRDVFRFTPTENAKITIAAESATIDSLEWSLFQSNSNLKSGSGEQFVFDVVAGQNYSLALSDDDSIGSYKLQWNVAASGGSSSDEYTAFDRERATKLGSIGYSETQDVSNGSYTMRAVQDGVFTIQLESESHLAGSIRARVDQSSWLMDSSFEDGRLRLDLQVQQGQSVDLQVVGINGEDHRLDLANLLRWDHTSATLRGTEGNEQFTLLLDQGLHISVGAIGYDLDATQIRSIEIQGGMGNDDVRIIGSSQSEALEMRPGSISFESTTLTVSGQSVEQIYFDGRGGSDRAFMYDADTDDMLTANPHSAEMSGIGYRYRVEDVDRIYVHATSGGQDIAYLFDSRLDDTLVIRPQFSSLRSDDYLNYVSGFERVNAYANAGGVDTAQLYDSSGDDRFNTSGDAASIVGAGFFSYTRYFENVEAYSTAGGRDTAALYAQDRSSITVGIDFASFQEDDQSRIARGFQEVQTFVDNQKIAMVRGTVATNTMSIHSMDVMASSNDTESSQELPFIRSGAEARMPSEQPGDLLEPTSGRGPSLLSTDSDFLGDGLSDVPSDWLKMSAIDDDRQERTLSESPLENEPLQMLASLMELRRSLGAELSRTELEMIANPEIEKSLIERVFARRG